MPIIKATLLSWLVVTIVYIIATLNDGLTLNFSDPKGVIALCALIGFIVAIYFALFGGIALFVLSRLQRVAATQLFLASALASAPMLLVSVFSGEPVWVISTVVAFILAGLIYVLLLPTKTST